MSQEHVDLVSRLVDIWNRGNWGEARELLTPDIVMVGPTGWPESETTHGWDASLVQLKRLVEPWAAQRVDIAELKEVGDRVLAELRWTTEGKDSGIPLKTDTAVVCDVTEGRISRIEFYLDLAQARQAAEPPPSRPYNP
jgi:ketosteroid isomerase-like protein